MNEQKQKVNTGIENSAAAGRKSLPHVNFRLFLFCALGAAFGAFLYARIRFGGLTPSDFLFLGVFLFLAAFPLTKRRLLALSLLLVVFGGLAAGVLHLYTQKFLSGATEGEYEVEGTVSSFAVWSGYSSLELTNISLDGVSFGGKMSVNLSTEEVRPGDKIRFTARVSRNPLPSGTEDSYFFTNNIRYAARAYDYENIGRTSNPFLLLNGEIYNVLHANMHGEEADISYALLTGNSRMVDSGFMTAVRAGGIAHIFAVSGLHIGILYGVVCLIFRPVKKYAFLPAIAVAICYCALCGFSVSSVRALLMCAALSVNTFFGRKTDLLSSASLAGTIVLTAMPAQWLAVGFRLSFGACIGLSLFSGMFARGLKRIRIPNFLASYLSASLAVQIFTFPIMLEAFGYFSVWGLLLNLVFVPLLPVAFLTLLLCTFFALIIPPAAAFFLLFPEGVFAALLFAFALADFSFVLTGFSLGAAGLVWLTATVLLSERVRMKKVFRAICAGLGCLLFILCLIAENAVLVGCRIYVTEEGEGMLALVRTPDAAVLIIDKDVSLSVCEDFLARRYGGKLDAAVVLSGNEGRTINIAAFAGAEKVYARNEIDTGLRETDIVFGESFTVGSLFFRFEGAEKLMLVAEGFAVELDFENEGALDADLCIQKGSGNLNFFLGYGIILSL